MPKRRGRKSAAQTPAPKSERIKGSAKNPKGSASSEKSASKIQLSEKTITALQNKLKEFKKKSNKNITLNDLKAVYRRGAGAYSSSHRPTITGGFPNSRNAWAMARVNKFLKKASGEKVKAAYVQDDDLLAEGGEINEKNLESAESFQNESKNPIKRWADAKRELIGNKFGIEGKPIYGNGGNVSEIEVKIIEEDDPLVQKMTDLASKNLGYWGKPRLALLEKGKLIGGVYIEEENIDIEYLFDIAIQKNKRNKGYGTILINALIKDFIENYPELVQIRAHVVNKKLVEILEKKYGFTCDYDNNSGTTICFNLRNEIKNYEVGGLLAPNEGGGEIDKLIQNGIVEIKMYDTKPEHAKMYGFDSERPLYIQSIIVSEEHRGKGIGSNVMQYIVDYATKNGHDVIFGHITQEAEPSIDIIKSMLRKNGYKTIEGNNDFYKIMDGGETENPDIRYADGGALKELVVLHNINEYQILEANKLGGLVTPSIAILKAGESFTDFGSITLIATKDLINPENSSVRVFSGDVYSPSVPRKLFYVDEKRVDRVEEEILKKYYNNQTERLHDDIYEKVKRTIGEYSEFKKDLNKMDYNRLVEYYTKELKVVYLIDKNIPFKVPMKEKRHFLFNNVEFVLSPEQKKRFRPILEKYTYESNEKGTMGISEETRSQVYDLFLEVLEQPKNEIRERYKNEEDADKIIEHLTQSLQSAFEKYVGTRYDYSSGAEYKLSKAVYGEQILDEEKFEKNIDKIFNKEVKKDYEQWVKDFLSQFRGAAYFLDGKQKTPYNLENLVEATTQSLRGKEDTLTYSPNKAKSFASKEFENIQQIKKNSNLLVSKQEVSEIDEQNKSDFFQLSERLTYKYQSEWEKLNSLAKAVADYYKGSSVTSSLAKNDFKAPSPSQIDLFKEYATQLKNSPVDYFEAKMGRAVQLNEFKYAVAPKSTQKEVIKILKDNGLKIRYYETDEERKAVTDEIINKDKKLKFEKGGDLQNEQSKEINMQSIKEEGGTFDQSVFDVITPEEEDFFDMYSYAKFQDKQVNMESGGVTSKKVICIGCGWEWDTADSEEYDKYLCHQCGFNNTPYYEPYFSTEEAFKATKTLPEISEKHGVSVEFLQEQLKKGIEHEKEHTEKNQVAEIIALHHIEENPKYYQLLEKAKLDEGGNIFWEMKEGDMAKLKDEERYFYLVGIRSSDAILVEHTKIKEWNDADDLDSHLYYEEMHPKKNLQLIKPQQLMEGGGVVIGKRHSEADENGTGEKFVVKSTGQIVELEGGEGVLCKESMNSSKLYEFDGKPMTGRQIASFLNHKYGGVKFDKGGEIKNKVCGCKAYYHGGELPSATLDNLEGGEAVVTVKTMESNDKYNFRGAKMTPREILSYINHSNGGKKFEDGGIITLHTQRLEKDLKMVNMLQFVQNILYNNVKYM